jgi:hypothetical protein
MFVDVINVWGIGPMFEVEGLLYRCHLPIVTVNSSKGLLVVSALWSFRRAENSCLRS